MKNTYSESELKEKAEAVFTEYTAANEVFATVDGNVFLQENRARLHATPTGKVYPFYRAQLSQATEEETDEQKPLNANAAIAFIKAATTMEAIAPFANDIRATVKAAHDKKALELAQPVETVNPATEAQTPTE